MQTTRKKRRRLRRGAAAVETAVVAPVLVFIFFGAVDTGQYANSYQKVSDAAREGARFAARYEVTDASQVTAAVRDYLGDRFPNIPECTLAAASTVTLREDCGCTINGSELGSVETGEPVEVIVTLDYDAVRWMSGLRFLDSRQLEITSVMRRE